MQQLVMVLASFGLVVIAQAANEILVLKVDQDVKKRDTYDQRRNRTIDDEERCLKITLVNKTDKPLDDIRVQWVFVKQFFDSGLYGNKMLPNFSGSPNSPSVRTITKRGQRADWDVLGTRLEARGTTALETRPINLRDDLLGHMKNRGYGVRVLLDGKVVAEMSTSSEAKEQLDELSLGALPTTASAGNKQPLKKGVLPTFPTVKLIEAKSRDKNTTSTTKYRVTSTTSRRLCITLSNTTNKTIANVVVRWGIVREKTEESRSVVACGGEEVIVLAPFETKTIETPSVDASVIRLSQAERIVLSGAERFIGYGTQVIIAGELMGTTFMPPSVERYFDDLKPADFVATKAPEASQGSLNANRTKKR